MPPRFVKTIRSFWRKEASPVTTPSGLTFQFMSDLHLEVGQQYDSFEFPVTARYLILAGDIGRLRDYDGYLRFLARQTARYAALFLVLGNHEFYGLSYPDGEAAAQRLALEPILAGKLNLLHRKAHVVVEGDASVHILGCPLWSHVPDQAKEMVGMKINDFRKIDGWTVESHNAQHEEDLTWLKTALAGIASGTSSGDTGRDASREPSHDSIRQSAIVVTHHAPCVDGSSGPEHAMSPWGSAFSTDLLVDTPHTSTSWTSPIRFWVFGHTHYTTELTRGGVTVVSNQRGYVVPGYSAIEPARDADHSFTAERVLRL